MPCIKKLLEKYLEKLFFSVICAARICTAIDGISFIANKISETNWVTNLAVKWQHLFPARNSPILRGMI